MRSGGFARGAVRAFYWLGMAAIPFVGTLAITVAVFGIMQIVGMGSGLGPPIVIGAGLASWVGLMRLYRAIVPLPCRKRGRSAKASSLNPVTVRCSWCGDVEVLKARVLGAS